MLPLSCASTSAFFMLSKPQPYLHSHQPGPSSARGSSISLSCFSLFRDNWHLGFFSTLRLEDLAGSFSKSPVPFFIITAAALCFFRGSLRLCRVANSIWALKSMPDGTRSVHGTGSESSLY